MTCHYHVHPFNRAEGNIIIIIIMKYKRIITVRKKTPDEIMWS
jgi:hypothetical protein